MKYDYEVVCMKNNRPYAHQLAEEGWEIFRRFMPVERDWRGKVVTNFWWLRKPTGGGGGNVDLTEVFNRLDGLDIAMDQVGQIHDQLWLAIDAIEPGNVPVPFPFEFEVWGADDETGIVKVSHPSSTKDHFGRVIGNTLKARFTIDKGTVLVDGVLYIVPEQKAQPDGWAFLSVGKFVHWCEHHGYQLSGTPEWHAQNEFGGKKGIRMAYDTYSLLRDFYPPRREDGSERHDVVLVPWAAGGKWYVQGRSGEHLTAFGGDVFAVEISL